MSERMHKVTRALLSIALGAASGCHTLKPQPMTTSPRSEKAQALIVLVYVASMRGNPWPSVVKVVYSDGHVVRPGAEAEQRSGVARGKAPAHRLNRDELAALLDELRLGELRKLEQSYTCPDPNGKRATFPGINGGPPRVVQFTGPSSHSPSWQLLLREETGYRAISLRGPTGCEPEVLQHAFARLKDLDGGPWSPDTPKLNTNTLKCSDDAIDWPRTWGIP
jgi:hypothetical protein